MCFYIFNYTSQTVVLVIFIILIKTHIFTRKIILHKTLINNK